MHAVVKLYLLEQIKFALFKSNVPDRKKYALAPVTTCNFWWSLIPSAPFLPNTFMAQCIFCSIPHCF